jgi:hypothetical protein
MTTTTNTEGDEPAGNESTYGPYLRRIPENPVNGLNTIQIVPDGQAIPEADDSHGWIYQASTLTFKADCTGLDKQGNSLEEY